MELKHWETGIKSHIPALELFLKQVVMHKCKVEVAETAEGSNEDAAAELKKAGIVIRAVEETFQTEIFFGFGAEWIPVLSREVLGVEEAQNNEITQDLVRELLVHLLQMVEGSFREIDIELKLDDAEHIKSGQLNRAVNLQHYLTARLEIGPRFGIEGDTDTEPLSLTIAMAQPDKDNVELLGVRFQEENPFLNNEYVEISSKYAGYVDIGRAAENEKSTEQPDKNGVSIIGSNVEFETFSKATAVKNSREVRNIDILKDVEMNLSVELGKCEMPLGEILQLVKGSVIELEKLAGESVEILVNGHKIAHGDVVVVDEHFGVRISHLLATQEHIKGLG